MLAGLVTRTRRGRGRGRRRDQSPLLQRDQTRWRNFSTVQQATKHKVTAGLQIRRPERQIEAASRRRRSHPVDRRSVKQGKIAGGAAPRSLPGDCAGHPDGRDEAGHPNGRRAQAPLLASTSITTPARARAACLPSSTRNSICGRVEPKIKPATPAWTLARRWPVEADLGVLPVVNPASSESGARNISRKCRATWSWCRHESWRLQMPPPGSSSSHRTRCAAGAQEEAWRAPNS